MPRTMKSRVGAAGFVMLTIAGALSGCSSSDTAGGGKGSITVWMKKQLVDEQNTEFVKRAQEYGKAHDVNVKVEIIAYEDFYPKWAGALESGNVPDVSFFGYQEVGQFYAQKALRNVTSLSDRVEKANGTISDTLKKPVTFDGAMYAIPAWAEAQVLIYRKDLLEAAGVRSAPDTWEQFRTDAAKVTDKGKGVYGAGVGYGQKNSDAEFWTRALTWSYGGSLDASPADAAGTGPANVRAAQLIKGVFDDGSAPRDALNWDDAGNNRSYLSGQSAMVFNSGSLLQTLRAEAPQIYEKTGVTPFPAGPEGTVSPGIMNTFGIFAKARNPEGGSDLISYMLQKDWYTKWTDLGAPLAIPVFDELRSSGVWAEEPNKAFADSVTGATFLGSPSQYSPAAGQIYNDRLVNKTFQEILINKVDPAKALAALRESADQSYAK
ncbi:ABC transporter substrate-binding protein [Streptomyces paludis]|uniref:Extracellular solute-binding protein n=1 Tax=Streptomyces paludis TaxID=2282738 RepID=A0A345HY06_9ACTN|nr:extracellular solute-binding protein [Streptomyces paludis]AXG81580.1 extracellular solute-binding protein [Streptomyces paludis]